MGTAHRGSSWVYPEDYGSGGPLLHLFIPTGWLIISKRHPFSCTDSVQPLTWRTSGYVPLTTDLHYPLAEVAAYKQISSLVGRIEEYYLKRGRLLLLIYKDKYQTYCILLTIHTCRHSLIMYLLTGQVCMKKTYRKVKLHSHHTHIRQISNDTLYLELRTQTKTSFAKKTMGFCEDGSKGTIGQHSSVQQYTTSVLQSNATLTIALK